MAKLKKGQSPTSVKISFSIQMFSKINTTDCWQRQMIIGAIHTNDIKIK